MATCAYCGSSWNHSIRPSSSSSAAVPLEAQRRCDIRRDIRPIVVPDGDSHYDVAKFHHAITSTYTRTRYWDSFAIAAPSVTHIGALEPQVDRVQAVNRSICGRTPLAQSLTYTHFLAERYNKQMATRQTLWLLNQGARPTTDCVFLYEQSLVTQAIEMELFDCVEPLLTQGAVLDVHTDWPLGNLATVSVRIHLVYASIHPSAHGFMDPWIEIGSLLRQVVSGMTLRNENVSSVLGSIRALVAIGCSLDAPCYPLPLRLCSTPESVVSRSPWRVGQRIQVFLCCFLPRPRPRLVLSCPVVCRCFFL